MANEKNEKIEKKSLIRLYFSKSIARGYFGDEEHYSMDADEIVKEDANSVTINYESRGKVYTDTLPKAHVIISRSTETPEGARLRIERVQALAKARSV